MLRRLMLMQSDGHNDNVQSADELETMCIKWVAISGELLSQQQQRSQDIIIQEDWTDHAFAEILKRVQLLLWLHNGGNR